MGAKRPYYYFKGKVAPSDVIADIKKTLKEAKSLQENETDLVYSFNLCTKVVTEIKKGKQFDYDELFVRVLNDKQKVVSCYTNDLKKYYPKLF